MRNWLSLRIDEFFLEQNRLGADRPATLSAYRKDLEQFASQASSDRSTAAPSAEAVTDLIRRVQISWGERLSSTSQSRKAAALRRFLRWCFANCHLDSDLSRRVIAPKVRRRLPRYISADEAIAVLRHLTERSEKDRLLLFLLLYGSGLRISEACDLAWSQLDLTNGLARVAGKGGKERVVPMLPSAVHQLNQVRSMRGPWIWGDSALAVRAGYQWIRDAGSGAGLLRPLNPHALRHSYATHLLTSGANLRVLQVLLGHGSLEATSRYTHLQLADLSRTLENHHPVVGKRRKSDSSVEPS